MIFRTNHITTTVARKILSSIIFTGVFFLIAQTDSQADNLKSGNFRVQMSTIEMTGGNKSSASFKLGDSVGQTAQGKFTSSGFKVLAGFQYIRSIIPFRFTISNLAINLGLATPQIFKSATNNLTITNGSAYGFTVKAIEDRPLTQASSITIPNTTCDPSTPCTTTTANPWTSNTAYGFGYNMTGQNVDTANFVNSTYFRPFPNAAANEQPVTVMSGAVATTSATATVTYQVNVAGSQAAGIYQNIIQYLAIPAY